MMRMTLFLLGLFVLAACERAPAPPQPVIVADVKPVSSAHALPPAPSAVPAATTRPSPLRWTVTPGGGVAYLPRDEKDPDGAANGSIHGIGDAAGIASVLEHQPRAALTFAASEVCTLVPTLVSFRDRISIDLDIMAKIDARASACVRSVRPRALSFIADSPLSKPLEDLLTHLDDCEALGVSSVNDEVALLLGSRATSPDGAALRSLTLAQGRLSAAGFRAIASRTKLQALGFRGTSPSSLGGPSGIAALAALPDLERLDLSYTYVTDEDLAAFSHAKALRWLMLESTKVGDAGIVPLAGATELRYVNISATKVGDAGVVAIAGLPHVQTLDLGMTAVTDQGLAAVGHMKELQVLELGSTKVTDVGLAHLTGVPLLRELSLPNSVSKPGVARWQAAHPKVRVRRSDWP